MIAASQGKSLNLPDLLRDNPRIILFDGVCNLCAWTVGFVFRNDTKSLYRFAWVQSPEGKEILRWCGLPDDRFDTMVTLEDGRAYYKSTAFLHVVRNLRFPWPLLWAGMVIPEALRDRVYDFIARTRYRFFGRQATCRVPEGTVRGRFLQK